MVADAEAVAAAARRVALPVADGAPLLKMPMLLRTENRLLRPLRRRPRLPPRLLAEQVLPVRRPQVRHQQVVVAEADAEARCRQLPVPAALHRAAVSRTGPVTGRSRRAS